MTHQRILRQDSEASSRYTERMKQIVVSLGLIALLVLAVLGNSAVMFVSGLGIGIALWLMRKATLRTQLVALFVGGLVASLGAEAVHTIYHLLGGETASGDSGFFFVSAFLVGLINAIAMAVIVLAAHYFGRPRTE